jgi:hypothetical protein
VRVRWMIVRDEAARRKKDLVTDELEENVSE